MQRYDRDIGTDMFQDEQGAWVRFHDADTALRELRELVVWMAKEGVMYRAAWKCITYGVVPRRIDCDGSPESIFAAAREAKNGTK